MEVLARAAAEDAAWLAFQRMSAWWLGENANVAANEYAGTSGMTTNDPADLVRPLIPHEPCDLASQASVEQA